MNEPKLYPPHDPMGEFSWQLQNGAKSAATLSDIEAALAERGLCVVAKVELIDGAQELKRAVELLAKDEGGGNG